MDVDLFLPPAYVSTREGNVLTRVCHPSICLSTGGLYPYPIMLCNICPRTCHLGGGVPGPPRGGTQVRYPPSGEVPGPPSGGYPGPVPPGGWGVPGTPLGSTQVWVPPWGVTRTRSIWEGTTLGPGTPVSAKADPLGGTQVRYPPIIVPRSGYPPPPSYPPGADTFSGPGTMPSSLGGVPRSQYPPLLWILLGLVPPKMGGYPLPPKEEGTQVNGYLLRGMYPVTLSHGGVPRMSGHPPGGYPMTHYFTGTQVRVPPFRGGTSGIAQQKEYSLHGLAVMPANAFTQEDFQMSNFVQKESSTNRHEISNSHI